MLGFDLLGSLRGNDAVFFPLVFLHAISALAGFGSVGFAGTYASRAAHLYDGGSTWRPEVARAAAEPGQAGAGATGASESGASEAGTSEVGASEAGLGEAGTRTVGTPEAAGEVEAPAGVDPEIEEVTRYFERPARFWKAILLVPVFGLLALWAEPRTGGLDQVWVLGALLIWVCACLLVMGLVVPGLKQMSELLHAPPATSANSAAEISQRARMARAGSLASRGAAFCDILFFVALALMIWRP